MEPIWSVISEITSKDYETTTNTNTSEKVKKNLCFELNKITKYNILQLPGKPIGPLLVKWSQTVNRLQNKIERNHKSKFHNQIQR